MSLQGCFDKSWRIRVIKMHMYDCPGASEITLKDVAIIGHYGTTTPHKNTNPVHNS